MRVAIIGGTFDPIHIDHIRIGCYVRDYCNYSTVLFVPAYQVPLRAHPPVAAAHHRLAMTRAALQGYRSCKVEDTEITAAQPSYVVRTAKTILNRYRVSTKIGVVIGDDLVSELPAWKNIADIAPYVTFIVMRRNSTTIDTAPIQNMNFQVQLCTNVLSPISSTLVRSSIARHQPFRHLVPQAVYDYINANNLYRE